MVDQDDWRRQGQDAYLKGVFLIHRPYEPISADWDHDHCEFCGRKFSTFQDDLHEGYSTEDRYHWVCESCFNEFKAEFHWEMAGHNSRQLELMLETLTQLENGEMSIGNAISRLEALVHAMDNVDPQWKNRYLGEWGVLEDVYAVSLDRSSKGLRQDEMSLVKKAVKELRDLVEERRSDERFSGRD